LVPLLYTYNNYFDLDYDEILRLDRSLIEQILPIKLRFKPYKKSLIIIDRIKKEIEQLLKDAFTISTRYVECIYNIISVLKKKKQTKSLYVYIFQKP
jgi:CRISPR/Cas system endoribonuclease Cas6 (RAMP superfamily)